MLVELSKLRFIEKNVIRIPFNLHMHAISGNK